MNSRRLVVYICVIGLALIAAIAIKAGWNTMAAHANPILLLLIIFTVTIGSGVVFVTVVLPRLGDAVGEAMFSSGEEVTQDGSMRAAAKMASGDYEGAIEEYKKALSENPDDPYPVSEISKILTDKLGEPDHALLFLQGHLEAHGWTAENAAFLMFRMVDVHLTKQDFAGARDILEQVCANLPDTRQSANARHKLIYIDELEFKAVQEARAKAARAAAEAATDLPSEEPMSQEEGTAT